jgi:hypothetical protein
VSPEASRFQIQGALCLASSRQAHARSQSKGNTHTGRQPIGVSIRPLYRYEDDALMHCPHEIHKAYKGYSTSLCTV